MSHITDGLLHAHLDGAVGPDREQEWILADAHLGVCEDCRRRLEEERRIRGSASAILAEAAAPAMARPSFDQLVALAGSGMAPPARPGWWRSTSRLAWAASLVLAAGAGWLGRELLIQTGRPVPAVVSTEQQAAPATEMLDRLGVDDARDGQGAPDAAGDDLGERARENEAPPLGAADAPVSDLQKSQAEELQAENRQDRDAAAEGFADNKDALPRDEVARRAAAAPAFAEQAVAAECFALDGKVAGAAAETADQLSLMPDGIAAARLAGRDLNGTWTSGAGDTVSVALAGAERRVEMRLARVESGLSGSIASTPVPAEVAAKLEGAAAVSLTATTCE